MTSGLRQQADAARGRVRPGEEANFEIVYLTTRTACNVTQAERLRSSFGYRIELQYSTYASYHLDAAH